MPNIELVGFPGEGWDISREIEKLIVRKIPQIGTDAVITIHQSSTVIDVSRSSRPYVRVSSTNMKDQTRVAKLINRELKVDVEWLHLDGFFEGKG